MSSPSEVAVGTVIADTYEVTRQIGKGGMGAVYEAKHRRLPGKRVAVKVLLGEIDQEAYARFRREAEIASKIGHPSIVEVIDFHALASGQPYLIMEFLEGESLRGRLKRGPLAVDKALDLVRQVGSALHAAHKHDVVHRDLKPDNIFLCPSDMGGVVGERVKVLDFGISKIRNTATVLTQDSALLGTPQYMSPEQASGKNKTLDHRTDVFALGCIVYEMLTGGPAFNGETLATVLVKVMMEQPEPLPASVPAQVKAAVEKAMEKDPDKRFQSVSEFIGALTGVPLQTLDRRAPVEEQVAFAATAAGTPAPKSAVDAFAATGNASLARGEVGKPSIPPTHVVSRGKGALWAVIGAGVTLVFGVVGWVVTRPEQANNLPRIDDPQLVLAANQPKTAPPAAAEVAPPAAAAAPAAVAAAPPVAAAAPPAAAPVAAPPAVVAAAEPVEPAKPVAAKAAPAKPAKAEAVSPEVAAELDEAERALSSGNAREAIRLATHSLQKQRSARAFSLIARGHCKNGDLGNAKAALHSVAGSDKSRVKRECKAAGVELD